MGTIIYNGRTIVDGVLQLDDLRVEGSLGLEECAELTALPEGLSVSRWLNLERCTALAKLPDGLSVGGSLYLDDCTSLTALPDGLSVCEDLYLRYCTALTNLPDGLIVEGWLNLYGCTALTALPDGLSVGGCVYLDNLYLSSNKATLIGITIAHAIRTAAIGRRLGDLIDHWALSWNGMRDQVIESIEEDEDGNLVFTLAPHATTAMSQPLAVQKGR